MYKIDMYITHAGHSIAYDCRREGKGTATLEQPGSWAWLFQYRSSNAFTLCDPVTLTFDLLT